MSSIQECRLLWTVYRYILKVITTFQYLFRKKADVGNGRADVSFIITPGGKIRHVTYVAENLPSNSPSSVRSKLSSQLLH